MQHIILNIPPFRVYSLLAPHKSCDDVYTRRSPSALSSHRRRTRARSTTAVVASRSPPHPPSSPPRAPPLSLSSLFAQTLDLINGGGRTLFQIHSKHNLQTHPRRSARQADRQTLPKQKWIRISPRKTAKERYRLLLQNRPPSQLPLPPSLLPASIISLHKVWLFRCRVRLANVA